MFKKDSSNSDSSARPNFLLGLLTGIAVISVLGFFALLVVFLSGDGDKVADANMPEAQAEETNEPAPNDAQDSELTAVPAVTSDDYIRGDVNAPVTMIVYDDFECPFCLRFKPTLDQILDEYEGKVRLVYRHFPLSFHRNAQKAAEAAEAAGEQGKFWEMHDAIFEANENEEMSVDKWKEVAQDLGLNTSTFNDSLDSGKYASKVSAQMKAGAAAGVTGTPGTFVNGELVSGALPFETFKQIIDSLLE